MGFWDCDERLARSRARQVAASLLDGKLLLGAAGATAPTEFPRHLERVRIGREEGWADFLVEPERREVSRRHLELQRQASGHWKAVRQGSNYVAVNGRPVVESALLRPGDVLTLGGRDGPQFTFDLVAEATGGATDSLRTRTQELVRTTEDVLCRNMRLVAAGFAVAALAIVGLGGNAAYQWWERDRLLAALGGQIAALEESSRQVPAGFDIEALQLAAHLIVLTTAADEPGQAIATAWPINETQFVTNAHVVAALANIGPEVEVWVLGPRVGDIAATKHRVRDWDAHPAYEPFRGFVANGLYTRNLDASLSETSRPGAYDLALLTIEDGDDTVGAERILRFPRPSEPAKLEVGDELAFAGYLLRGVDGCDVAALEPVPRVHFGTVSQQTDFFLFPSHDAPEHARLIHNTIPVTGGASGGPIVNKDRQVVGIVSSGTVVGVHPDFAVNRSGACQPGDRQPSAVLVNYAQRVDLVWHLTGELAFDEASERARWESQAAKFVDHKRNTEEEFVASLGAGSRSFTPALSRREELPAGLHPQVIPVTLEAGRQYGALAYALTPEPLQLMLRIGEDIIKLDSGRAARIRFSVEADTQAELLVVAQFSSDSGYEISLYRED